MLKLEQMDNKSDILLSGKNQSGIAKAVGLTQSYIFKRKKDLQMDNKFDSNHGTFDSVPFDKDQYKRTSILKDSAEGLLEIINAYCPDGREKSIAITKLEECLMWASKSISREQTYK